jgi:hypothetical protein
VDRLIPVQPQPEPTSFDQKVRSKGAAFLKSNPPTIPVPSKFWNNRDYWRAALSDLRKSYSELCAFSAVAICPLSGFGTVEHFKPKRHHPTDAYEWSNFRLVCGLMNGRKGDHQDVLDPFTLPDDVFELNPLSGGIYVHPNCPAKLRFAAQATIDRLQLDDGVCRRLRKKHVYKIVEREWTHREAMAQSPFVFARLKAQGLI